MNIDEIERGLGERLRKAREEANMTQYQLSKLTGIATTQISAYENGKKMVGLQTLARIAEATNKSMDEIYFGAKSLEPIVKSSDDGELIINCANALFERNIIKLLIHDGNNEYVLNGMGYFYKIGFYKYVDILDDFLRELTNFESKKENYPNPVDFKKQLLASAAKQINDRIRDAKEDL